MINFVDELLDGSCKATFIQQDGTVWDVDSLDVQRRAVSAFLAREGVGSGDRIIVPTRSEPRDIGTMLGILTLGAICVLVNEESPNAVVDAVVNDCNPVAIVRSGASQSRLIDFERLRRSDSADEKAAPRRTATQAALIIYTSGSSGKPKGVVCSHASIVFSAKSIQNALQYSPVDRIALFLPITFDYGLYQVFLALLSDSTLYMYGAGAGGPGSIDRLVKDRITVLPSVAPFTASLVRIAERKQARVDSVRMVTNTGADLPSGTISACERTFPNSVVVPMYGMTECKRATISRLPAKDREDGAAGIPLDGTDVWVHDGQKRCDGVVVGEIHVSGPNVMDGYWGDAKLSAERFYRDPIRGKCLRTGDIGYIDTRGELHVLGRRDDIFKSNGYRVSVSEIEAAALECVGVESACVLPPKDSKPYMLVFSGDCTSNTLREALRESLDLHKVPDEIRRLSDIPLTSNGKLDRAFIAEMV